jgi:hypothetical protein
VAVFQIFWYATNKSKLRAQRNEHIKFREYLLQFRPEIFVSSFAIQKKMKEKENRRKGKKRQEEKRKEKKRKEKKRKQ